MSLKDEAKQAEADLRQSLHGCNDALKMLTTMARYACELKDTLKLRTTDVTRLTDENGNLRQSRATLEKQLSDADITIESLRQQLRNAEYKIQNTATAVVEVPKRGYVRDTSRVLVDPNGFNDYGSKPPPTDAETNVIRGILQSPLMMGMGCVAKEIPALDWYQRNERMFKQDQRVYFQDMLEILRQSAPVLTASPLTSKALVSGKYVDQDATVARLPKRRVVFLPDPPATYKAVTREMKLGMLYNPVFAGLPGFPQALTEDNWITGVLTAIKLHGFRQVMVDMVWLLQQVYGVPGKNLGYWQERGGPVVQEYRHWTIDDMTPEENASPLYALSTILCNLADKVPAMLAFTRFC